MKRLTALLCIYCFASNLFAQDVLATFKNNIDNTNLSIKEVIPVINQRNNDLCFFVLNSKNVYGYLLNENFEIEKSLSSEDRRRKYKTLIGYGIIDKFNYDIILTNTNKTKFATVNFSFNTGTSELKEFELDNPQEKFIQTVTINNICYLIAIARDSNSLKFYKLDGLNPPKSNQIDFSDEHFIDRKGGKTKLYTLFKVTSSGSFTETDTPKIDYDLPNTVEVVSEEKKIYVRDDKIVFTFDINKDLIQIITIHPEDFSYTFKTHSKNVLEIDQPTKKSNSFLGKDALYTLEVSKDSLGFQATNYHSNEVIKQIRINKNDSITFKNTSIVQEGGVYDKYRELESTQKLLRKLRLADLGISVYKPQDQYEITIGSKKEMKTTSPMLTPMGNFGAIPIASLGSVNMFFNPTLFAYYNYNGTRSVYVKSLFDKDFNHIKGEISENIFDLVKDYTENRKEYINQYKIPENQPGSDIFSDKNNLIINGFNKDAETIFKYKSYLIFGEYHIKSKTYILRQFKPATSGKENHIVN